MRIVKINVAKFWKKVQLLCILLVCDEMMWGMSKIIADKFGNSLILMYSICDEMMRGFQKSLSKTFENF